MTDVYEGAAFTCHASGCKFMHLLQYFDAMMANHTINSYVFR